jgi:cyclic pyranopterin phosphate synthase
VKKTPDIIPMCHNIPIDSVTTDFTMAEAYIEAHCRVDATYKTGVEMEALTGVTVALLTIWDMVKYIEKDENGQYPDTRISEIKVDRKTKGKE